jgi:hypothetical protein
LIDDGLPDVAGYNAELDQQKGLTWLSATMMYSECYMYRSVAAGFSFVTNSHRRIQSYFSSSTHWSSYDVFARSKTAGLKSSLPAILELATQFEEICLEIGQRGQLVGSKTEELFQAEELLFSEMCKVCLWGNKTDLSIFTTLNHDDIQRIQGSKARKESEAKILVNDVRDAFKVLQKAQQSGKPGRVDIVLDNAGFELFVDLVLAGYLLTVGLATAVVLHPKCFPWFVSDVTPPDFQHLLGALHDSESFFGAAVKTAEERAKIAFLFDCWSTLHAEGKLILRPNRFWTEGGSFWRLPATAPALYEDLQQSELVLFKGDLNYRKLTADGMWEPTTAFSEAIGPLGARDSGVRVLALRTCKADVIVGLPKGRDEELKAMEGGGGDSGLRTWAYGGTWAVMQFHDGKQGAA